MTIPPEKPSGAVVDSAHVLNGLKTATSTVSDALDVLGLDGAVLGMDRMSGTGFVAGPAYTLQYEEVSPDAPGSLGDYIDDIPADAVLVMANDGRVDCSVWGDLVSRIALRRRVAGTVIDGACRDLDAIREIGYPVWARASCVRTGRNRARLTAIGTPVRIGSITVGQGDLICADASGVVRVRAEDAEAVTRRIERIETMERQILAAIEAGGTLAESRAAHGYHQVAKSLTDR